MRHVSHLCIVLLLSLSCVAPRPRPRSNTPLIEADLVLRNGRIWTAEKDLRWASSLAIKGERILFVGSDEQVRGLIGPRTRTIHLHGRLVTPGFIDSHLHLMQGGFHLEEVQLRDAKRPQEMARRIAARAKTLPPGTWILGGNWDNDAWPDTSFPTRELIDPVTPKHPVLVSRYDRHMALANTVALELAGITAETTSPEGGEIGKDPKTQRPTGVLKDEAIDLVSKLIPAPGPAAYRRAAKAAVRHANRHGITSVHDIRGSSAKGDLLSSLRVYQELRREEELTLRLSLSFPLSAYKQLHEGGMLPRFGDGMIRIFGLKAFVDGSLGSRTAWFFEPYADQPDNSGLAVTPPEQLSRQILQADRAGFAISVHAIGDRANSVILDLFGRAIRKNGKRERSLRVEHAQHIRPADFERFVRLSVVASVQPYHTIDDGRWAETRIGAERCRSSYAFRTFLDRGVRMVFGSDWPVVTLNPLEGIYAAVTRRTIDGKNPDGWFAEQKISVSEALRAYTIDAARELGEQTSRGSIKAGKLADLVVLSRDLLSIDPVETRTTEVMMTIVGGQVVFDRSSSLQQNPAITRPTTHR